MPKVLSEVMDKLDPLLKKVDYRGPMSVEVRIVPDGTGYVTDMTMRFAYSLSLIYTEYLENYSDVVWAVANGQDIVPKFRTKYIGGLALITAHGKNNWTRLMFPDSLRKNLKLEYACKVGKYYYLVEGCEDIGMLVYANNSIEKILAVLQDMSRHVECLELDTNLDSLRDIRKSIEAGRKIGLNF
jgi:hypothetical protein